MVTTSYASRCARGRPVYTCTYTLVRPPPSTACVYARLCPPPVTSVIYAASATIRQQTTATMPTRYTFSLSDRRRKNIDGAHTQTGCNDRFANLRVCFSLYLSLCTSFPGQIEFLTFLCIHVTLKLKARARVFCEYVTCLVCARYAEILLAL